MIFVDTWAWIALADKSDQYHSAAAAQHRQFFEANRKYITSDFVLTELINYLYTSVWPERAEAIIESLFQQADAGEVDLIYVSQDQFRRAWLLRKKYRDKPDISFIDLTSMIVMQDLGIRDVFTGDAHFQQVGLSFRLFP
jgi:predicted nucleic acid-binding protein